MPSESIRRGWVSWNGLEAFEPSAALRRWIGQRQPEGWLHEHISLRARVARTRQGLWEVVEHIEQWDRPLRAARQGRKRLLGFERALAAHIAGEEAEGHLDPSLDLAPRYQRQAAQLRHEHPMLIRDLHRIRTMALGADVSAVAWADVYQAFDGFAERLRLHEEAENEIMAAAVLDDLGPGD